MNYTVNLTPKRCHICGGYVIYTSNDAVYGKSYGSGFCYLCTMCKAYVGTHKHRPLQALGILANDEMRVLRRKCHDIFDKTWSTPEERKARYAELADKLGLHVDVCHFGYFNKKLLEKAYKILTEDKEGNTSHESK